MFVPVDAKKVNIKAGVDEDTNLTDLQLLYTFDPEKELNLEHEIDLEDEPETIPQLFESLLGIDVEEPEWIPISGISEVEVSTSKDSEDIRGMGGKWLRERTTQISPNINIGGFLVQVNGSVQEGQRTIIRLAESDDDVREFKVELPRYEREGLFRVAGEARSTDFKEKLDWSAELQQFGE